jgi:hypothetical protein
MESHQQHGEHIHVHGPTCGHTGETHGDHTDYLHEGHRHRSHEQHWDECALEGMPAGEQIDPHADMTRPEEMRTSTGT